jgi:hypothetical protein
LRRRRGGCAVMKSFGRAHGEKGPPEMERSPARSPFEPESSDFVLERPAPLGPWRWRWAAPGAGGGGSASRTALSRRSRAAVVARSSGTAARVLQDGYGCPAGR